MKQVTLQDVATHVGVSAKTVSNVVNGHALVSEDLRERVHGAIIELGYRPNLAARQLRSGRSGMIALALPDLMQPYFAELAAHTVRAAQEREITVLVTQTDSSPQAEQRIADGIGMPLTDGLIFHPMALSPQNLENRLDTTPLVLLGEQVGMPNAPQVRVDTVASARSAVEHLIARGRRRIAAIGVQHSDTAQAAEFRLSGYREALTAAGIPVDERLIRQTRRFERADGADAATSLVESGVDFDAIFAINDLLALGAMHVLSKRGRRVPEDVAVIGYDSIAEGAFSNPTLSSVAPDLDVLARTALDLVMTEHPEPGRRSVPYSIVERASTGG